MLEIKELQICIKSAFDLEGVAIIDLRKQNKGVIVKQKFEIHTLQRPKNFLGNIFLIWEICS